VETLVLAIKFVWYVATLVMVAGELVFVVRKKIETFGYLAMMALEAIMFTGCAIFDLVEGKYILAVLMLACAIMNAEFLLTSIKDLLVCNHDLKKTLDQIEHVVHSTTTRNAPSGDMIDIEPEYATSIKPNNAAGVNPEDFNKLHF